jgi:hypothetical protein
LDESRDMEEQGPKKIGQASTMPVTFMCGTTMMTSPGTRPNSVLIGLVAAQPQFPWLHEQRNTAWDKNDGNLLVNSYNVLGYDHKCSGD